MFFPVMELGVPAKWLLPEIMEFVALALLMTAKSQVSGFGNCSRMGAARSRPRKFSADKSHYAYAAKSGESGVNQFEATAMRQY